MDDKTYFIYIFLIILFVFLFDISLVYFGQNYNYKYFAILILILLGIFLLLKLLTVFSGNPTNKKLKEMHNISLINIRKAMNDKQNKDNIKKAEEILNKLKDYHKRSS